jgi:hypothetical protein
MSVSGRLELALLPATGRPTKNEMSAPFRAFAIGPSYRVPPAALLTLKNGTIAAKPRR